MKEEVKENIKKTICNCLRKKLAGYKPESNHMPFHHRLLGKDRMALYSFIHSLNTAFGISIFEPVAVALARGKFKYTESQHVVGNEIYSDCQSEIQNIIDLLSTGENTSEKSRELENLRKKLSGTKRKQKPVKADLYFVDNHDAHYLFDLKTVKPNISDFKDYKRTMLEWAGIAMTANPSIKINTIVAIPYNPYEPEPYERWTMKGMFDLRNEILVGAEFWDFIGGEGAYNDLLDCFEKAGIEMRAELDACFARYKNQ